MKFGKEFTTAPDNISNDDNSQKAKTLAKQKTNQIDFFNDTDDDCINNTETNKQNNNTQTVKNCPSKGNIIYRILSR